MPGYGILPADQGGGLLSFGWAEERLAAAPRYWLSTVCPDGRPHAMAVWAVWLDGAVCFSTGAESRKAKNLTRDPRCTLTTESAAEAVVVEGTAERIAGPGWRVFGARLERAYLDKYGSGYPGDSALFAVRPRVVFGFVELADQFCGAATRWSFEDAD